MEMNILITEEQFNTLNNLSDLRSDADSKIMSLMSTLKNTVNEIPNDWNSKQREEYIFDILTSLPFTEDGSYISTSKSTIKALKNAYNSVNPNSFTIDTLGQMISGIDTDKIYVIHEPFGSKASPDFLFITSKGLFGVEDKSSKNQKVSFNTGTPGGNKFIMYYDKKDKTVYLISGSQWGWDENIEKEFKKFTKDMINHAKEEFQRRFGDRIKNMDYYARPMLVDKNKIKDIAHKDEEDVLNLLKKVI